jgi:hypothetical protein
MKSKNCKVRYTYEEKVKTLRILESNSFNYLKTSHQTIIARPTLARWVQLYGKEVFKGKSPTEEALVEIDAEMKNNDIHVIRNLYLLRKRTLQRVMVIAEKETRLDSLLKVLAYTSDELDKFSEGEKGEQDSTTDYVAYITKIMFGCKDDPTKTNTLEK